MSLHPVSRSMFSVEPTRSRLLAELWQQQLEERYITTESIKSLAHQHQLSDIEVEGVASFYHFFHRKTAGKHTIYLNNSIVSELKGYDRMKEAFER